MAYLKIARMGHPILRQIAQPVKYPQASELQSLLQDMHMTMLDAGGAGLAAPQVHHSLRIILCEVPDVPITEGSTRDQKIDGVFINPVFTPVGEEMVWDWEGCLSIPGLRGFVPRYRHIHYHALSVENVPFQGELEGFPARVFQHEVDHLDGILYIDRMPTLQALIFEEHLPLYKIKTRSHKNKKVTKK